MTDSFYWSASAGRWMGVPVRIHFLLFIFVALIFGVEWNYLGSSQAVNGTAFVTTIVLLASLLLHELAHIFAITNLGGHVNSIVFSPWGGNSDFAYPATQRERAVVLLAGPFANGIIALLGAALLIQASHSNLFSLLNPFAPFVFETTQWEVPLMKIVTWVNFQLCMINLIPCFPFDGAGILRALVSWINPLAPRNHTEANIRVIGHAVAFTLLGFAWLARGYTSGPIQPVWLILFTAGITLLFSARYSYYVETAHADEDWDGLDDDLEYESLYDESSFYEFPEDENSGYSQWLAEKQEARKREEARIEREEDVRADDILKRLHTDGIENISDEDKQILNRVSARLRRKNQVTDSYE